MSCIERLKSYCMVDTQSNPKSSSHPSSEKQFNLANLLVKELKDMGVQQVELDPHCYVYAHIPANSEEDCPSVGFLAHMDTSPDFCATDVNPRIIENYDGKDIVLNGQRIMRVMDFPRLKKQVGKTLMVTDGDTLLGGDDKAGITAIMEAVFYLMNHPDVKHGPLSICFTSDEEIGMGARYFDVKKMNCDFAYTVDGGSVYEYSDETFNADSATVHFKGLAIHPGEAKDKMINATSLACQFQYLLPKYMKPEHTSGREGFIHLSRMQGNVEKATLEYILRDHDRQKLQYQHEIMDAVASYLNVLCKKECVTIEYRNGYRNMKEVIDKCPYNISKIALESITELGYEPDHFPVRGGTDGSEISFMGIPCPNLGAGGSNFHGPYEYVVIQELEDAVKLVLKIVEKTRGIKK